MLRLLSASVAAARKSGAIIRQITQKGDLKIKDKGYDDPQTEADRQAQHCIVATLQSRFPGICVVGEEDLPLVQDKHLVAVEDDGEILECTCPDELRNVQLSDVTVWVDPLDGTNEFTRGFLDHVTTLVGISVSGKAVGGVIHQPFFNLSGGEEKAGRMVWGLVGLGVFGVAPIASGLKPSSTKDLRLCMTLSHSSQFMEQVLKKLDPKEVHRTGGAGNKILMVVEGRSDVYVHSTAGTKKWDTCAGEAILRACGAYLTDLHGNNIVYDPKGDWPNENGIIAAVNDSVHKMVRTAIADIPQSKH